MKLPKMVFAMRRVTLVAVLFISILVVDGVAQSNESDAALATAVVDQLLAAIVETAEVEVPARYEVLAPVVQATHDLGYIARITVRRQFQEFTEAERDAFLAAFTSLSVANYAGRFIGLSAEKISRGEASVSRPGQMLVPTTIVRGDGMTVAINYVMRFDLGSWKIVNVVADGVSDIALKRAEFAGILNDGTVKQLIEEIERQTQDLMDY